MKPTKIKPVGDRILVEPVDETELLSKTIIVPEAHEIKSLHCIVRAIGDGKAAQAAGVQIGDRVIVAKYGGHEIEKDGHAYKLMHPDDLLGIVTKH